jgi:multidrug efflux pump subunit AcrB
MKYRRSLRLPLILCVLMVLVGYSMWTTMPRQEDPSMPDRWGFLIARYPGATPEEVESVLAVPFEQALQQVDHILEVESSSRSDVLVMTIELDDSVYEVEQYWQRIREAIAGVAIPAGVELHALDTRLTRQESILIAVTGSDDLLALGDAAAQLRRRLLRLPNVREVREGGQPGAELTIELEPALARSAGVDAVAVAEAVAARTGTLGLGSVPQGERRIGVRMLERVQTSSEIRTIEVQTPAGPFVPIGEVATIGRRPAPQPRELSRYDGAPAVILSVVADPDIDLVSFGVDLRAKLPSLAAHLEPGLRADIVLDQTRQVAARIDDLQGSLLSSTLIVVVSLLVTMGLRMAILCGAMVPLSVLSSIAAFAILGGTLDQISLAGTVMAIGMVVDNAIVVVEELQRRLDLGESRAQAAQQTTATLSRPLLASTGTTVAAFLPMLVNVGAAADFTRAIPITVILALIMSLAFSIYVLPGLASKLLRQRAAPSGEAPRNRFERAFVGFLRRPLLAMLPGLLLLLLAIATFPSLGFSFFPPNRRPQTVIDVQLREGARITAVSDVVAEVEREALALPEVAQTLAMMGRGLPHFYYNLSETPAQANFGQILLGLHDANDLETVEQHFAEVARELSPDVELRVVRLKQGPPVVAPIEILLYSSDLTALRESTRRVAETLASIEELVDVRDTIDAGAPIMRYQVDPARTSRWGVDLETARASLLPYTVGIPAGTVLRDQRQEPVVVRERAAVDGGIPADAVVVGSGGRLRLDELAKNELVWLPAAIARKNSERFARVTAELADGVDLNAVRPEIERRITALDLAQGGVEHQFAGEAEGAQEANSALVRSLPVGLLLLLLLLVWEFDSLRCVALILITVPLAAIGVVPALVFAGQPFGFMSALGLVALVGIVVNNAIILLDLTQELRSEGMRTRDAVYIASSRRLRPILLTTLTTVLGLVPLLVSNTSLWPPLAWTIISGLTVSTVLTLITLPTLVVLVFRD